MDRPRIEPPTWYRVYDPAMWDTPDRHEQMMIDGSLAPPEDWPAELHAIHARRRWGEAKYRYSHAHPQLAEQEFQDLQTRHRERHDGGPGTPCT